MLPSESAPNRTNTTIKYLALALVLSCFACSKSHDATTDVVEEPIAAPHVQAPTLEAITVNSEELHYLQKGQGEPVVFIHGTISNYSTWNRQLDTFATHYQVTAYSRRYAAPNQQIYNEAFDYTPEIHSVDLLELIDALDFEQAHLVGHSYGAFTALTAALKNPGKVKSLVLGEPPVLSLLRSSDAGESLYQGLVSNAFNPAARAFNEGDESQAVATFIGGVMGDTAIFRQAPESARQGWLANTLELKGYVIKQENLELDTASLKQLDIPVLLMKGEASPAYFGLIIDELHRLLPNSIVYTLSNSSHGLQGQNPRDFNREVLEFLSNY